MFLARPASRIKYHLITIFLFTKSDIKTTLIPITVFALLATPVDSSSRILHVVSWIYLHLLQFDISNQTLDPQEDIHNKSDRPLPSGRLTLAQAVRFRWLMVPVCLGWSYLYSVQTLSSSVCLVALTIIYNELHAHSAHWAIRNLVNALGFASFETGATLVAGPDPTGLDSTAVLAICLSAGIFFSTIHTQDFKDCDGDRLVGRETIPIVFPNHGRKTVVVALLAWSFALSRIWNLDTLLASGFLGFAAFIGARFLLYTSIADDQVSFYLYNVWLSCAHALPGYWRISASHVR